MIVGFGAGIACPRIKSGRVKMMSEEGKTLAALIKDRKIIVE